MNVRQSALVSFVAVLGAVASCQVEPRSVAGVPRANGPAALVAAPTAVTISPTADTYLNIDDPPQAKATESSLNAYTWPDNKIANAIVMKFDLGSIPPGSVISSATLNLHLRESDATADPTYTVTVHKVINKNPDIARATGQTYDGLNPWSPSTCCYNNIPLAQADIGPAVDTKDIDKTPGFKQWNVTSIVQSWFSNPSTNFGLLVNSDPTRLADRFRFFASNEDLDTTHRPSLTVVYAPDNLSLMPNEPPGFVRLTDQRWDAVPPQGNYDSNWWYGEITANASTVSDPSAPKSPSNVLACHVPTDTHDGPSVCQINRDDFTQGGGSYYPKLYVAVWVEHSQNWVPHPVGSKMLWLEHPYAHTSDGQICSGYSDVYTTFNGPNMQLGVVEQNCQNRQMYANTGDGTYNDAITFLGQWQRYEFLVQMNTLDQANGVFQMWVDGQLICDYQDVRWVPNATDPHLWTGMRYHLIYGGAGGKSASQYEYVDHIYVSGGN